jgi:integrase
MRHAVYSVKLKHLNASGRFASGNVRYYFRPKGKKGIAMPDLPVDHPRFLAAYAAAAGEKPRAPVRAGSIAAAVIAYKASTDFKALAQSTRNARRRTLDAIAEQYGTGRIADLRDNHIRADLTKIEGHVRNNRLKVWRGFCNWAKDELRLSVNAAESVKRSKTKDTGGRVPWDDDQIAQFRAFWPISSKERLAFELIYWTGARVSDAIRLGEGNVDREGWLVFRQQKTNGEVSVPFRRELPEFAERMRGDLALLLHAIASPNERHLTFIVTRFGASRSPKAVSQWFAAKARKAGIEARTAHGLRKSRTIALIEAQATTHQTGAWTGHESLKEIEHYGKKYDRRRALSKTNAEHKSSNSFDQVPKSAAK